MSLSEAISAYQKGEYERARDACLQALARDMSHDDLTITLTCLGHAEARLGAFVSANDHFSRALSLEPPRPRQVHLHYQLALGCHKLGNNDMARQHLLSAIERFEEPATDETREAFVRSLVFLGLLECGRGEETAALTLLERASQIAIHLSPMDPTLLLDIDRYQGELLFRLKRSAEAIPLLRRALMQVQEKDVEAKAVTMCYLGLALAALGESEEAVRLLEAVDVRPSSQVGLWAATRLVLGNLYYAAGDFRRAIQHFEQGLERPPSDGAHSQEFLALLADCYLETGNVERGLMLAEQAFRGLPGTALVRITFAKALAAARRYGEAQRVIRQIEDATLNQATREKYYAHSCYIAIGLNKPQDARIWLSKLRETNPSSNDLGILATHIARLDR